MKVAGLLMVACMGLALGGCSNSPTAAAGGQLVGTLAATAVGSVAARAMVESDRRRAAGVLDSAPDGQPASWRNPETGVVFVLTPTRSFEQRGVKCRDYMVDATVGGRPDRMSGSACRQSDGDWHVMG